VERVWRTRSEYGGAFISVAMSHWEMVVTRHHGTTTLTLRGPETRATLLACPADGEWLGIRVRLGTGFSQLPASFLRDSAANLPNAAGDLSSGVGARQAPLPGRKRQACFEAGRHDSVQDRNRRSFVFSQQRGLRRKRPAR